MAYRIGGEQLATMTFFAPTSFAIWIISLEVVPRTIESESMLFVQYGSQDRRPTINQQDIFVCELESHRVELFSHVLPPGCHQYGLFSKRLGTCLICCPGMMKVLPTYRFLMNPSR